MTTSNQVQSTLTKKDLYKMAVNLGSLGMEFSWNFQKQMAFPFCLMMNPILEKIYKDNEAGYQAALTRHMEFFNITPQLAPFVGGIVASMEEAHARGEVDAPAINSIKAALMGPLSGIGDSIFLGGIRIIALGVGLSLAMEGSLLGPIVFWLIYNLPAFFVRFFGARKGYEVGIGYLTKMQETGLIDKLVQAAGIIGIMVIGSMSTRMVYTRIALEIGSGETAQGLQGIMDSIMPGMLALGVTWLYYWLLKKKTNPFLLILGTIAVGVIGVALGVFAW